MNQHRTKTISPPQCMINVVEDFGADNTGQTPAHQQIQAALNAAMEGPARSVYLPDGTYRVDSGLVIDKGSPDDTWSIHVFSDGGAMIISKSGIAVFTVQGLKFDRCKSPGPRRVHFQRLHLIRETAASSDSKMECGFRLEAPECRLDDVEISGFFEGAGVRLIGADLTNLHRCRLWHNWVNVEDQGDSQASELTGCRLTFASDTGLVWNSRGLTILGGAIEMNSHHEVVIGDKTDAVARFYGVHFEHKIDSQQQEPMIVCGLKDKPSSTQAVFDHCQFFGNGTNRAAIKFLGVDTCQVISSRFESFKTDGELIQTFDGVSKHITVADSLIIP